jgi:flagellar hook protein FlgE
VVSLEGAWDGTDTTEPILTANYEYQTTVKVYDSLGSTHDITVYYDPDSATAGEWDYIITCNPSEDNRTISQADQAGLLARGTITFNTGSGEISGITMDTNDGDGTWTTGVTPNANGYLEFSSEFIGGSAQVVELNVGARHDGSSWVPDSSATTQFSRASTTTFQSSDGYGAGDLQGVDVDVDGVITGTYSNGQLIPLYRVALAKFQNVQGLNKEGGNLYRETRVSGEAITNRPGTNGLGSISPNSLEQSNVDIATEFVKMITTQRGFQANGKIITVTDSMLAELIQLKR